MHAITAYYVIATKRGRRACAGRAKHVVDLDLAVARTGPHDVGAGRAADPPGGTGDGRARPRRNRDKTLSARLRKYMYRYTRYLTRQMKIEDGYCCKKNTIHDDRKERGKQDGAHNKK